MKTITVDNSTVHPIIVPSGADVVIVEKTPVAVLDLQLETGATAKYVALDVHNGGGAVARQYNATVAQDAKLEWVIGVFGDAPQDCVVNTRLVGERAEAKTYSAFFTAHAAEHKLSTFTYHDAPHTVSEMIGKGAVAQKGSAEFVGRIVIPKGSVGCSGEQVEDALFLSPEAKLVTTPDLEIATDDVHCGHASSTTYLSPEKLFYFSGRGIDPADAASQIVHGHFAPILSHAPVENTGGCGVQISDTIEEVISAL